MKVFVDGVRNEHRNVDVEVYRLEDHKFSAADHFVYIRGGQY